MRVMHHSQAKFDRVLPALPPIKADELAACHRQQRIEQRPVRREQPVQIRGILPVKPLKSAGQALGGCKFPYKYGIELGRRIVMAAFRFLRNDFIHMVERCFVRAEQPYHFPVRRRHGSSAARGKQTRQKQDHRKNSHIRLKIDVYRIFRGFRHILRNRNPKKMTDNTTGRHAPGASSIVRTPRSQTRLFY